MVVRCDTVYRMSSTQDFLVDPSGRAEKLRHRAKVWLVWLVPRAKKNEVWRESRWVVASMQQPITGRAQRVNEKRKSQTEGTAE